MENYTLSDLAAVTKDNDNDMNGSWFWIVVLFLFMFGFGGGGFGANNAATAAASGALTRAELYDGLNNNQVDNSLRNIGNGLCDGFYAQNTTMLQGLNGVNNSLCQGFNGVNSGIANLGYQQQNCCCETNRNIDSLRYENAKNTCDITNAIHSDGETTRALINQNTMQELRDQLQAAQLSLQNVAQTQNIVNTLRPYPSPAYITCSPYTTATGVCGCSMA